MSGPQQGDQRESRWQVALLVLLPVLVFASALRGEYHLDDHYRIAGNDELERFWPPHRHFLDPTTSATLPQLVQYRPLLPLSLSIDRALADALGLEREVGYHAGNLAIHLAGVLLLFGFLRELLSRWGGSGGADTARRVAFAASLLYAVHPVTGVPVHYLCARDLLLMFAFLMAALRMYLRWRRLGGAWRMGAGVLFLALSLASKTNAIVAPALVLAFEVLVVRASLARLATWTRALPFALVCGGFIVFTEVVLDFSDAGQLVVDRAPLEYPSTELRLHVTYYLRNAVWPFHLRPLPRIEPAASPFEPGVLLGLLIALSSAAAVFALRRRAPHAAFGIAAYWILFLPTSSVFPLRSFAADYRQVPSLAALCLVACLAGRAALAPRGRGFALVLATTWFATASFLIGRDWRTEELLWARSTRLGGTALAHHNYAVAIRERDPAMAEQHLRRALELYPDHVYAHVNLGLLLIARGEVEGGLQLTARAVAIRPDWGFTYHWHSIALGRAKRDAQAVDAAWTSTALDPRNEEYRQRAVALAYSAARRAIEGGEYELAISHSSRIRERAGSYRDSLFLEGYALQLSGEIERSLDRYRSFLKLEPGHARAQYNIGYALLQLDRHEEAIEALRDALELDPDNRSIHTHLATCLDSVGRTDEASHERTLAARER